MCRTLVGVQWACNKRPIRPIERRFTLAAKTRSFNLTICERHHLAILMKLGFHLAQPSILVYFFFLFLVTWWKE